ncbi:hypothetical protein BCR44DRAFT_329741 [Catenaria anguillulae PL171]|uniref:Uncharacterized protein n=1 Tax=Catenaria anguillulae PL171 TaxID=765915 RepID=A0A1Y2H412_9FUNG|nr:hypothetical protein BCR44DRAFT_329741 [Catenaria anguillulae PL171]
MRFNSQPRPCPVIGPWTQMDRIKRFAMAAKQLAHDNAVHNLIAAVNAACIVAREVLPSGTAPTRCCAQAVVALMQPDTSRARKQICQTIRGLGKPQLAEFVEGFGSAELLNHVVYRCFSLQFGPGRAFHGIPSSSVPAFRTALVTGRHRVFVPAFLGVQKVYEPAAQLHAIELLHHCGVDKHAIEEHLGLSLGEAIGLGVRKEIVAAGKVLWFAWALTAGWLTGTGGQVSFACINHGLSNIAAAHFDLACHIPKLVKYQLPHDKNASMLGDLPQNESGLIRRMDHEEEHIRACDGDSITAHVVETALTDDYPEEVEEAIRGMDLELTVD